MSLCNEMLFMACSRRIAHAVILYVELLAFAVFSRFWGHEIEKFMGVNLLQGSFVL